MKKINFKEFVFFLEISKENNVIQDVRKEFADLIYSKSTGIQALDISLKIHRSQGAIELNAEEVNFLTEFAERSCTPAFIVSLREALNNNDL